MANHGDILLNPIRMRIVQMMADRSGITIAHISERMNDVPKTTLYRHMNVLLEHGYVTISRETRIRGTYEREYTLNLEMLQPGTPEDIEKNTITFLMKLIADFSHYFKKNGDPVKDRLFLSGNTLLLSDDEYGQFMEEIFAVMKKYMGFSAEKGRRTRTISIVSSPGQTGEDADDK